MRNYTWHYLNGYLDDQASSVSAGSATPDAIFAEDAGGRVAAGSGSFLREAEGRFRLYERAPVMLPKTGVIAGNLDKALMNEVIINRTSRHFFQKEVFEAVMASGTCTRAEKDDLAKRVRQFEPQIFTLQADAVYNEDERLAWESNLATCNHYNGHQVLDYGLLLSEGIPGLLGLFAKKRRMASEAPDDLDQLAFYDALTRTFEGAALFIQRHADLAAEMAGAPETKPEEVGRLSEIDRICRTVASARPAGFAEGLSLLWFFIGFADYDSIGRFDQYLYPLYQKSCSEGMTREDARRLLEDFWRMMDENGAILNMTIGGNNRDGSSAVNELTWLVLEVTREMRMKGPNLCLRLGPAESGGLWEAVHRSLSAGQALPALYNEAEIIPMLLREGIGPDDAWDFCLAGCSQIVIPGKSSFACDMGTYNTLKCLELALHDGFDPMTGHQAGPHTGAVESLETFEAVLEAYRAQTEHAIKTGVAINNKDHAIRADFASCIRSALTSDCLERGKPLFRGGARYYAVQNEVVGLTNTANALLGIRQVIFDEKRLSLPELAGILDNNFEGHEVLRQHLLNHVPKFGNGSKDIDELRGRITEDFFTRLSSHPAPLGGRHWPGEVIFHYHVTLGQTTLASSDGRRSGVPLADSAGPSQGTDRQGILGILQSMKSIRYASNAYPNTCCCLNLKFDLDFWQRARSQLILVLKNHMKTGFQLQINVLDAKDLEDALVHPENHRWLVVRVGGYSAYFTSLDPKIQRDIIARTTQVRIGPAC